jgi:hypothetical protein
MMSLEKWQNFFKNILVYCIFITCILVGRVPSNFYFIFNYLPSIDILFLYYYFLIRNKNSAYIHLHLFLLGLIIDTFNFLPLGLSELSLLLGYKVTNLTEYIFFKKDSFLFLAINNLVFLSFYFIFTWFFLSLYQNNFIPMVPMFLIIIKNVIYFNLSYFTYKKFIK